MDLKHLLALSFVILLISGSQTVPVAWPGEGKAGDSMDAAQPMGSVQDLGSDILLENGLINLKFNKTTGGLSSVYDPYSGTELRQDKDSLPTLFQLSLVDINMNSLLLSDLSPSNFSYSGSTAGTVSSLTIIYSHLGGLDINVSCHIEVKDNDPRSYWDIAVQNANATWAIDEVRYPIINGIPADIGGNGIQDILAVPKLDGAIYIDPYPKTQVPNIGNFRFQYPGELSMQFMALYDPAVVGIYIDTQDTDGNLKEFFMENQGPSNNVSIGVSHAFPMVPGAGTGPMYRSSMAFFHGDWYKAANIYKGWSQRQSWASKGKIFQRPDVPQWWLDPSPLVVIERRDITGVDKVYLEQWSDVVASYKAITGTNITLKVLGWEKNGSFAGPFYLPAKDMDPEVKTEVKEVIVAGGHVMFSTSERLWRLTIPRAGYDGTAVFDTNGRPWAIMNLSTNVALDPISEHQGMSAAVMDPTTGYWQDLQSSISAGIANDIVDIQELQDLPYGAWVPCYDASHGHVLGMGDYLTEGHLKIVGDSFSAGRAANPDFMLTTEGPSELFLGTVQSYRNSANAPEQGLYLDDLNRFHDDMRTTPMFAYVYHQYISAYGTPVPIASDIPAQYNASARAIAKTFIDGALPSVMATGTTTGNQRLSSLYARTSGALATYGRDYMYLGQMLEPPSLQSPMLDVPYRVDPREGQEYVGWSTLKEPQVLSSAWKNKDDTRVGIALVNWGNSSVDVDLNIPSYGLPDENYTFVLDRNGERSTLLSSARLPHSMILSLSARDVVLIEVLQGPDLALEDLRPERLDVITGTTLSIAIDVANRGSIVASGLHVTMFEDGAFIDDISIGQLGPNMNTTVPFSWSTDGKAEGAYNLTAKVWPVIGEVLTSNNEMSISVNVVPPPTGDIRCTVIDNWTKKPLTGTNVVLFHPINGTVIEQGVTGISNDAVFMGLLPGTYGLNATKAGYYPAQDENVSVIADKTTQVTLSLAQIPIIVTDGDLTGLVLDNNTKAPMANAKVVLVQPNLTYYTAADGIYLFTGVEAGIYDLIVTRTDYHGTNIKAMIKAGTLTYLNVSLVYIPPPPMTGDIVGYALDKATSMPIAGALVRLSGDELEPMETVSDPAGGFSFPAIVFGSYVVNVTATGYLGIELPAEVKVEGANEITVRMTAIPAPPDPKITLMGFVRDKKGKALQGAELRIIGQAPPPPAYSDQDGFYQIKDLKPGIFSVIAERDGHEGVILSVNATKAGTVWLNITMSPKDTGALDSERVGTYIMVALLVFMILGIVVMLLTGKRGGDKKGPKARPVARKVPLKKGKVLKNVRVVAVKKMDTKKQLKEEEE